MTLLRHLFYTNPLILQYCFLCTIITSPNDITASALFIRIRWFSSIVFSAKLESDCSVEGISGFTDEGIHILRHSAAHLLAQAITSLYPDAKPTIGPAIDRGFYYDFADLPDFSESDLKPVQKKMHEIARRNHTVERVECTDQELAELFATNSYKIEIINGV